LESIVFQRLALSNLLAAADLFTLARRRHSGVAWHQARIGLKYFRYVTENFLPQRYARWNSDVKRIQDLLGDVHDLDLLRTDVLRNSSAADPAVIESWREKIQVERKPRLAEAIAKTSGSGSLLHVWQAAFEIAHSLTVVATLDRRTA
jgi:CHAD domain-containing protein